MPLSDIQFDIKFVYPSFEGSYIMRLGRILLTSALVLVTSLPCLAKTYARRGPTSPKLFKRGKSSAKHTGQRVIDDGRATQIQSALIKSGYLSGEASGHWDASTQAAMQKFQADNGWQTKLTPDSRAIIKLGLGPSQTSEMLTPSPGLSTSASSSGSAFLQKER
jgi:peptidoglycan hydrolase-like protein with peptidoglycan-binding domain